MSENEMKNLDENEVTQPNENEKSGNDFTTLRLVLHVLVIVILLLGIIGLVPKKITIPSGAFLLFAVSIWNALFYRKLGRHRQMVFTFVISGIIAVMLVVYFLLEYGIIG